MLRILVFGIALILCQEGFAAQKLSLPDKVDDLQNEVDNHTTEIRIIEEKLKNQLIIVESIRDQFQDINKSQKDFVKNNTVSLENRILSMEANLKSITSDLKLIQSHANETANALKQYKQKIAEQSDSIDTLQKALSTLMEAMQVGATAASKTYVVQSGDTLEKIAKRNKTTVKEITGLNRLQNAKIYVGQTLKLP